MPEHVHTRRIVTKYSVGWLAFMVGWFVFPFGDRSTGRLLIHGTVSAAVVIFLGLLEARRARRDPDDV